MPFTVKNAASRRSDHHDPDPVEPAEVETDANRREQHDRQDVQHPGAPKRTLHTEADRYGVQSVLDVEFPIEQRVEDVEARDPDRNRAAERPRFPRQPTRDRHPRADRREAVDDPEPDVAQPCEALQVGIDDEAGDRDRPEPAHDRIELEDGDEEDGEGGPAERGNLGGPQSTARKLTRGGAGIPRIHLGIDEPVQRHRERPCADHRDGHPDDVPEPGPAVRSEEDADVRERQREDRVLDLHERGEPPRQGVDRRAHVCRCGVAVSPASSARPC